ncbi:MAG: M56 family metallopeptidase [Nannocystales bacterium]
MSVLLSQALIRFLFQGIGLGVLLLVARPILRQLEGSTRFAVLFAALLCAPGLVLWNLAQFLAASPSAAAPVPPPRWAELVFHGWLLGVALSSLRTGLELRGLQQLRATGLPLRNLHGRLHALAQRLGVHRAVALVESPGVTAPIVIGWLRPMIMLPLGLATSMPEAWLDAILAHELAHLRRHDLLLRMLQRCVEILFFFHPVVWWIGRQLDTAREEACDDLVVDRLRDPLTYARALTELEAMQHPTRAAMAAGATEGQLMQRISHILRRSNTPPRPNRRWSQVLTVAATMSVAGYAVAHATEEPTNESDPSGIAIRWMPESVAAHEDAILGAADRHGVDPDLLAIVVLLESRGNAKAKSPTGARGLMQLMPKTAEHIAATRGLSDHAPERLDEPRYNLDLGAWYLAQQLERFEALVDTEAEAVAWAAAAYNGGPSAAAAALHGEAELSEETARYQTMTRTLWAERGAATSSVVK